MPTERELLRRRIIFPTLHAKLSQQPHVRHEHKRQLSSAKTQETPPTSPELSPQQQPKCTFRPSIISVMPSLEVPLSSNPSDYEIFNSRSCSAMAKGTSASSHLPSFDGQVKSSLRQSQTNTVRKLSESIPMIFNPKHAVSFDPKVWVIEFQESLPKHDKWFNRAELSRFRYEAALCRLQQNYVRNKSKFLDRHKEDICMSASTFQRTDHKLLGSTLQSLKKEIFNYGILTQGNEDNFEMRFSKEKILCQKDSFLKKRLLVEIQRILIVDPSDIFSGLFVKSFRNLLGDQSVNIVTASSGVEAWRILDTTQNNGNVDESGATQGFDLILVEEQLMRTRIKDREGEDGHHELHCIKLESTSLLGNNTSIQCVVEEHLDQSNFLYGSDLIRCIVQRNSANKMSSRLPFIVGVTAHVNEHQKRIRSAGADMVWGKPPPKMDNDLRLRLLSALLDKKGHNCGELAGRQIQFLDM